MKSRLCGSGYRRVSKSALSITWSRSIVGSCLTVTALWLCNPKAASAQTQPAILPDETLGDESSVVVPDVEIRGIDSSRIDGGARRGTNLFHSFQEFNIELNRGAFFSNPEGIDNILTRVTGGNLSTIDGTLGVLGNANLFLINPNGLVFGPGASLDINGSFFGSTAESVLFEAYGFSAVDPSAPPPLTLNVPIGLQFGENPGDIVVRSPLQELTSGEFAEMADAGDSVETAQTVNATGELLPGVISGELTASGDVDVFRLSLPVGAVFSASTVGGTAIDTTLTLFNAGGVRILESDDSQGSFQSTLPPQVVEGAGEVLLGVSSVPLSERANPDPDSGPFSIFFNVTDPNNTGGLQVPPGETLALVGGDVTLENGGLVTPGGQVELGSLGAEGTVSLTHVNDTIQLAFPEGVPRADVALRDGSVIDVQADDGGSITINTRNLEISERSALLAGIAESSGFASARAGEVILNATDDITIRASSVLNHLNIGALGNGGSINLVAESFTLEDGRFNTNAIEAIGDAGLISIEADEVAIRGSATRLESRVSENDPNGTGEVGGNAGSITFNVGTFVLEDGARINTNLSGIGDAGLISIAADEVAIRGSATRLVSRSDFGAVGDAGTISFDVGTFTLEEGARVLANLGGLGNAGSISIEADEVAIQGNGTRLESRGDNRNLSQGNAGTISIVADTFTLEDRAQVRTSLVGTGNAGLISIEADEVAIRGDGTRDRATQTRLESRVGRDSDGDAGTISIVTGSLTLEEGATIDSSIFGRGNPGNVLIQADGTVFLLNDVAIFTQIDAGAIAEAEGATLGRIEIDANSIELREGGRLEASVREARVNLPGGQGNGGEVVLRARDGVLISGVDEATIVGQQDRPSAISTFVGRGAEGNAGSIRIETGSFTLEDGAVLISNTADRGNPGNIEIQASEAIQLDGSRISTAIEPGAEGFGGNIRAACHKTFFSPILLFSIQQPLPKTLHKKQGELLLLPPTIQLF